LGRKKNLEETIHAEYPEFYSEVLSLSADELNTKLATLSKHAEESENAKEDDEELKEAKALASELGAPYRDAKKALRLKSKFVIKTLKDKGAA
jgi:hypothetical protein